MPHILPSRFSAVRSAASRARALASTATSTAPASNASPSATLIVTVACGSSAWTAIRTTAPPAITPAWRAQKTAPKRASAGMQACAVTSPVRPRSSASAMRTTGSISRSGRVRVTGESFVIQITAARAASVAASASSSRMASGALRIRVCSALGRLSGKSRR